MTDLTKYIDQLANNIRTIDGNHDLGAGALAEGILNGPTLAQIVADVKAEAWDGAADDDGEPALVPTPGQLLRRMANATADERLAFAERAIVNSEKAQACFMANHRAQIATLRRALEAGAQ